MAAVLLAIVETTLMKLLKKKVLQSTSENAKCINTVQVFIYSFTKRT